jgi:hypothetical protein
MYFDAKSANQSQNNSKELVKLLEETGTKVPISTVKRVRSARKCTKTAIIKPDYGLHLHMETKIIVFGEMSSGLMKQKYNCLAIMTIVMFGGRRGRLASRRTLSQT